MAEAFPGCFSTPRRGPADAGLATGTRSEFDDETVEFRVLLRNAALKESANESFGGNLTERAAAGSRTAVCSRRENINAIVKRAAGLQDSTTDLARRLS